MDNVKAAKMEEDDGGRVRPSDTDEDNTDDLVAERPASLREELGTGWLQLTTVFFVNMLVVGFSRSQPIIYVMMLVRFGGSITVTSWLGGLQTLLRMSLGPVASLLTTRLSLRAVALMGGVIFSAGCVSSAFAPNIPVMYLTFSIACGTGMCFLYTTCHIVVATYFPVNKGFAFGIANVGSSVGITLLPMLWDVLKTEYGFSGFFLLAGGVLMHCIVLAAFFRTPRMNQSMKSFRGETRVVMRDDTKPIENTTEPLMERKISPSTDTGKSSLVDWKNQTPNEDGSSTNIVIIHKRTRTVSENNMYNSKSSLPMKMDDLDSGHLFHQSQVTLKKESAVKNIANEPTGSALCHLLKQLNFISLCLLTICQTLVFGNFAVFIKAFAMEKGIEDSHATFLVSISGLGDLFGNLTLPILSDLPQIRRYRVGFYTVMCVFCGLTLCCLPLTVTYVPLAVLVFTHTLLGAPVHTLRLPVAIETNPVVKDPKGLAAAVGCLTACMGLGHGLAPVVGGLLTDMTSSYDHAYYVAGAILATASMLYAFQACIISGMFRCHRKSAARPVKKIG